MTDLPRKMLPPTPPDAAAEAAAIVGVDWGSTHRRVMALDAQGRLLREFADDEGMLRAAGRFAAALATALDRVGPLAPRARVLLSGMVGSAQGWHEVPYLDTAVPLDALPMRLFRVPDGPPDLDCRIVPGYRWRGEDGAVDVMRGEETQLLGAVARGRRDGCFVLPGTHSKWVRLRDGRIERFATYLTGELFALLSQHGTLAPLLREGGNDDGAFADGVREGARSALSNALFGCRARVVAGDLPKASARDYLSGLLIGAEWHDACGRAAGERAQVHLIGAPELARRYRRAGELLGASVVTLPADEMQLAAWPALAPARGTASFV